MTTGLMDPNGFTVPGAISPSPARRYSSGPCDEESHVWRYVGVAYEPRRNLFEPRRISDLIYRCETCGRLGRAKYVSDSDVSRFERKVVKYPEFRADAREVFGWSDRDNTTKVKDRGNEKL